MKNQFPSSKKTIHQTHIQIQSDMPICQTDYPLDWYQEEFIPYAEEYLKFPDRRMETIIPWMRRYIEPALKHFGDSILLLAHYYMGGEIVKLIQQFGGQIGDSYQLALMAANNPQKKVIIESAVHFMAETISILAQPEQRVYITNPKSGCTMEMHAKDYMVEPALQDLNERYGKENILPICYMNTSGRIKAITGAQDGAVCTSSNVTKIFKWALQQNKKILFIPDQHMGENVASTLDIPSNKIAYWPGGKEAVHFNLSNQDQKTLNQFDNATLILFCSYCSVHTYYKPTMVDYWHERDFNVVVHPECRKEVVANSDASGSTAFIWQHVYNDVAQTKKYAVGTENHMVQNLKQACLEKNITVVNLGDAKISGFKGMGCGCATMSRNDPPHLVGLLDLLRQDKIPLYNEVKPGDVVDEFTGTQQRLNSEGQQWIVENAKKALNKMIEITEK